MTPTDELDVYVGPPYEGAPGRCVSVEDRPSHINACVDFASAATPTVALGSSVDLEFRSVDLGRSFDTAAVVIARAEARGWRRYVFRCDLSKRVFLSLLSRRQLPRVHPRMMPAVEILEVADPAPVAWIRDLSEAGLAIEFGRELEARLYEREHLELAVRLPGDSPTLRVRAAIRNRRLVDDHRVRYGLRLVAGAGGDDCGRKHFAAYVKALLGCGEWEGR